MCGIQTEKKREHALFVKVQFFCCPLPLKTATSTIQTYNGIIWPWTVHAYHPQINAAMPIAMIAFKLTILQKKKN